MVIGIILFFLVALRPPARFLHTYGYPLVHYLSHALKSRVNIIYTDGGTEEGGLTLTLTQTLTQNAPPIGAAAQSFPTHSSLRHQTNKKRRDGAEAAAADLHPRECRVGRVPVPAPHRDDANPNSSESA